MFTIVGLFVNNCAVALSFPLCCFLSQLLFSSKNEKEKVLNKALWQELKALNPNSVINLKYKVVSIPHSSFTRMQSLEYVGLSSSYVS